MKVFKIILAIIMPILIYITYDVLYGIIDPIKPEVYSLIWLITGVVSEISIIVSIFLHGKFFMFASYPHDY